MTPSPLHRQDFDHPHRLPPKAISDRGSCGDPRLVPDTSIFFADEGPKRSWKKLQEARLICRGCPVRQECQSYGILANEPFGVWGALDRFDRAQLLGRKPQKLAGERTLRPVVSTELACDSSTCSGKVPLELSFVNLTPAGLRYCEHCFTVCCGTCL